MNWIIDLPRAPLLRKNEKTIHEIMESLLGYGLREALPAFYI
jgi:hypothetical protein